MTTTFIYEKIYTKLISLTPNLLSLEPGDALKSTFGSNSPYMDLNLDVLEKNDNYIIIALSHYYKQNGDMIADPDMEIRIYPTSEMAEALTFQNGLGYQRVYVDKDRFYPKLKKDLNLFLNQWLKNCLEQGHQLKQAHEEVRL